MNETNNWLSTTGTATINTTGYSGTGNIGITTGTPSHPYEVSGNINAIGTFNSPGLTLQGNSTIHYSSNSGWSTAVTNSKSMTPRQVNVAVFTITRDADTNEINSTKFVKELWIEQKNGTSIDLLVAKQLDKDFDPEFTIIKVLATVQF